MWRAPSPTQLRFGGDLRDVEGAVPYGFGVCGGFAGRGGEIFIGIGDLRGVEGVVPYAVEVRGGFRDVEGVVAYGFGV